MNRPRRTGVSLIEVIACTAIVAVMIVPIASVMRASAQSIALSNGGGSVESDLRSGLRWAVQVIRDGEVTGVGGRRLTLQMPDSSTATVEVRNRNLVLVNGTNQTIITEDVRDVRFQSINRVTLPVSRSGVLITLRARDSNGVLVSVDATIAHRPQT